MSSYKTNSIGLPVYYLKNSKKVLWEWFHEEYPDGLKRTTFYGHLQGNQYIYKEDLGGLCSICNIYGYESFDELRKLIQCHILNSNLQVNTNNQLILPQLRFTNSTNWYFFLNQIRINY